MSKCIFVIIIFLWLFDGFLGLLNCKKDIGSLFMALFYIFVIFIPIIAHWCGLL